MKNRVFILSFLISMISVNFVFAQTSTKKLSYQAVVRNAANELVVNQNLAVEITILDAENAPQYKETHPSVPTNQNGLLWLWVGEGTPTLGTMEDVVWKDAVIRSVFTLPDGSTVTQNTPVTAMPHAFFADEVDTVFLQNYLDTHDVVPDNYVTHPQLNDTLGHYLMQEVQMLSIRHDTIFLSGGSFVKLPAGFSGSYHDLVDTPKTVSVFDNDAGYLTEHQSLEGYVTQNRLNDTLDSYYTKNNVDTKLNDYEKKSELCGDVKDCIKDTLAAYYDTADVKQMLKPYLKANELCDSIVKCDVIKDIRDSLGNAFDTLKYYYTSKKINDTLKHYYDTAYVNQTLKQYLKSGDLCDSIEKNCTNVALKNKDNLFTYRNQFDSTVFFKNETQFDSIAYFNERTYFDKDVNIDGDVIFKGYNYYYNVNNFYEHGAIVLIDEAVNPNTLGPVQSTQDNTLNRKLAVNYNDLMVVYDTLKKQEHNDNAALSSRIVADSNRLVEFKGKVHNDSLALAERIDTIYRHLCDSVMNCTDIKTMQTDIAANKTNIGLNKQAIIDSSAHIRNEIKNGQITIAVNRSTTTTETTVTKPTFGVNQEADQTVTINIPQETTVNNGQLTIVAAGDTTRFTANQAANDTVRLDKFATKEALKDTAKTLRGIICDSATACITKALADPTSEINHAIDTIARHHVSDSTRMVFDTLHKYYATKDTLKNFVNKLAIRDSVNKVVTDSLRKGPSEMTRAIDSIARHHISDSTRMVFDTLHKYYATKDTLKNFVNKLAIRDSVNKIVTDSLRKGPSEMTRAIDSIARHHVSDSTRMVFDTLHKYYATKDTLKNFVNKLAIRDSVNKVVTDSLRKGPSEMTRAIDSIARHHVSDSTRMVFDTLHKYYATKDTLKNFVNKLAIRDSVNNIVKDSLAAPNSAINIAIDTIARHNISDSTRMVFDTLHNYYATKDTLKNFVNKLAIRDSVNKVVKDSLRIGTSAINIAIDTIARHNIHDTAVAIRTHIRDSVNVVMLDSLKLGTSAINQAIDTIARHNIHDTAVAIRNSIGNGTLTIQKNGSTVGTFTANQSIDQPVNVNITVPTAVTDLSDAADYAKINGNTFTGTHNFNNASITVPSNTDAIKRPSTTTTPCTDMNAVNVCDLLAVFDSLTKRIDALQEELDAFKNAAPPVFNSLNLSEVTATSMKVTSSFTSQGFNITSYNFCYSTNSDMSGSVCVPSTNPVITLEGLDPYTTYYVTASATNVVGTTQSNIVNARTPASKPTATVTATTSTPKGITVSLSNLDFKQPGEGTVQIFYKKKTNETCGTNIADYNSLPESETISNGSPYSQTIPNLEQETAYCVIVKLQNADSAVYTSPIEATSGATNKLVISSEYFDLIESNRVWLCEHSGPTPTTVTFSAALLLGDSIDKYDNFTWSYSQTDNTHPLPGIAPSPISNGNTYTITFTSTSSYPDLINIECTAQHKITGEWISGVLENLRVDNNIQQDNPVHNLVENYFIVTVNNPPGHYDISYSKVIWGDGSEIERNVGYGMYHDYESAGAGTYNVTLINLYDYLGITSGCMTTTTVTVVEPPASIYKCTVTTPHQSPEYQSDGLTHRDGYEEVSNGKITSVTDYEGNVYPVVQIGSQCWIAENLRCQYSPNTGSNIVDNSLSGSQTQNKKYFRTSKGKSAHWFDNNSETYASYGLLYNYCAAMDFYYDNEFSTYIGYWDASSKISSPHRGICPKGWHIPTNDEWTTLKNNENANQPVKLAGDGWPDSQPGYCIQTCPCGTANRNLSGFTALPAARVTGTLSSFPKESTETTYFWSSTCNNSSYASSASMSKDSAQFGIQQTNTDFQYLYSVRCIRDAEPQP